MRWTLVVCAVVVLSACGSAEDEPAGSSTPGGTTGTAATSTEPTDTMTEPGGTMTEQPDGELPEAITEAEDGSRIELEVGSEIPWRLSSDWDWEQPTADGGSVELVPVDYFADPGFSEWLIVGAAPGTAELSVEGRSACGDAQDCPDRRVTLTVDVTD